MPILQQGARKLRNAGKLEGLLIITRTASETSKNTFTAILLNEWILLISWVVSGRAAGWTVTDTKDLQNIITPKPLKLKSGTIETMFILHHMSQVTSHMSPVTCHLSCVTCHMSPFVLLQKQLDKNEASLGRVCDQRGLPCLVFFGFFSFHLMLVVKPW